MKIILGIVVAVVIAGLIMAASWVLASEEDGEKFNVGQFVTALGIGCLVGVINACLVRFTGNLAFLAPISLIAMIAVSCYFAYWFAKEGGTVMEILLFSTMSVVVFFTTQAAAVMTAANVWSSFLASLVMVLPKAVLVASIGFYAIDACLFRLKNVNNTDLMRIITLIVVLSVIGTLLLVCIPQVSWGSIGKRNAPTMETEVADVETDADAQAEAEEDADVTIVDYTEAESNVETERAEGVASQPVWYKFYNLYLLTDADPLNDFNFGSNPNEAGLTAEDYALIQRNRMKEDPALAAADMAWLDAIVGTRYLGEFYESCKGDWAKTINLTKERFMGDQGLFYQTLNAYLAFMDTADRVELEYRTEGLDDQMYMNPFTVNNVPDVVVMTTTEQTGYFITYVFIIKGNEFRVSYRIDCGFQPTNVEKVMNIKPDDTPRTSNPGHSTGSKPDPTPRPGGKDDPTPKPGGQDDPTPAPSKDPTPAPSKDPTPTPAQKKKDKTKGTKVNTKPNDDPGPDSNTNNGVGSKTSTKDQPTNSNHMPEKEYKEEVKELKEINESQKTGNDPSTPSTTGPANTEVHVESNADTGNGGAPIDTPTEVSAKETVKDDPQSTGEIEVPD